MATDAAVLNSEEKSSARVFISYSRKDMAFADRLEAALKARGFETLIDRSEIYAFEEWWKRIEALIARADTVVFVLTPDSVSSDVALKEVSFAASVNKRFAPVLRRRVDDKSVPAALAKLNFIFFDDDLRFEDSTNLVAEALNTDIHWIRQHSEFGEQARRWALAQRPNGLLLRSPMLEQSEYWIGSRPKGAPAPTEETRAYIESRQAATRQRVTTRRVHALIYLLLVGIIAGLVAWINQVYIKEQLNWYMTMRPYKVANVVPYVLTATAERSLKPLASFRECAKDCPEMVVIPAGSFTMGSPATEMGRFEREGPQHKVTIAKPFAVSKFEVTFEQWDACAAVGGCRQTSDSGYGRGTKPVNNVNWEAAQQYVAWLSKMTERHYRLLTEAEWEYVARADTDTAFFWGDEIGKGNANCDGCGSQWDGRQPAPVGSFTANKFGLYDMHGNVWEWVEDCWHDDYRGDPPRDGSAWTTGAQILVTVSSAAVRGTSFHKTFARPSASGALLAAETTATAASVSGGRLPPDFTPSDGLSSMPSRQP